MEAAARRIYYSQILPVYKNGSRKLWSSSWQHAPGGPAGMGFTGLMHVKVAAAGDGAARAAAAEEARTRVMAAACMLTLFPVDDFFCFVKLMEGW